MTSLRSQRKSVRELQGKIKVSCYSASYQATFFPGYCEGSKNKAQPLLGLQNNVGESALKTVKVLLLSLSLSSNGS